MPESQIKVDNIDFMGDDLTVVNAARVSFDKESFWEVGYRPNGLTYDKLFEREEKLIKYLAKHKHFSPFGHCFASFRVTAPVFVIRQLVKHEYLRINEVSRRYVDTDPEFYTPDTWRSRAEDKKQGSGEDYPARHQILANKDLTAIHDMCLGNYRFHISQGMAPEQARMFLPLTMMTSWYWSGSLDAFANMCKLRLKEDTQYESRLVAQEISRMMGNAFPVSWRALLDEGNT